jgi:hypothetical protein
MNLESDPLLGDLIANSDDEISTVTFVTGFTGVTDIETGPDGNLYVLTFDRETDGQGSLYRILPTGEEDTSSGTIPSSITSTPLTPPITTVPPVTDGQDEGDTIDQESSEQDDEDEAQEEDNGEGQ